MQLYHYFRSSASYRVRIALALKGLDAAHVGLDLRADQHLSPEYAAQTPVPLVPLLVGDDGQALHQSLAIIEYLDETHPEPPLLPRDAPGRARVRALALDIACEIHPLNNLRVLRHLTGTLGLTEEARDAWVRHWIEGGLAAVERQLAAAPSPYSHGDTPTLADCVLVPQVYNARRYACNLTELPHVRRVTETCLRLPAFEQTSPEACADAT